LIRIVKQAYDVIGRREYLLDTVQHAADFGVEFGDLARCFADCLRSGRVPV